MPTYEYRCENGHEFERFQRMSEPPVDACPTCGAPAERLLSAGGGLLFKGSGFYITDYRKDSYKKAAQADSGGSSGGAKPEGGSSGGSKSDSGGSGSDSGTSKSDSGTSKSDSGPSKSDSGASSAGGGGSAKAD